MHFGRVCVIGVAALLAAAPCLAQDAMPDRTTTKREKVFVTLVDAEARAARSAAAAGFAVAVY